MQYQVVYALNKKDFLFAAHHYDDTSIAPALIASITDGAVHIFVLRDGGQGLTLGELIALFPAAGTATGKSCLFFQDSGGKTNKIIPKGSDGTLADQSFCPKVEDLVAVIGPYAPPP